MSYNVNKNDLLPDVNKSLWCVLIKNSGNIVDSYKTEIEAIKRCKGLNENYNVKVIVKKYVSE